MDAHAWEGERAVEPAHDAVVEAERRTRPRGSALPVMSLNLVTMIDVVFLLLVYFMLATDFRTPEEAVPLDLPTRLTAPADPLALPARPIEVFVETMGEWRDEYALRVEGGGLGHVRTVQMLRIDTEIRRGMDLGDDQPFVVRPGAGTNWEHVLAVYNALRGAGYARVRLAEPGGEG